MRYTLDISLKYRQFSIFRRNINDFTNFLANLFSVGKIVSVPSVGKIVSVSADIRYFSDISADINDFLFLGYYYYYRNLYIILSSKLLLNKQLLRYNFLILAKIQTLYG